MKGKYLITTDNWFIAPDGRNYKAVWGEVKIVEDTFLGIKTNRNSSNWFAIVGDENKHVVIAGCQIHYAIKSSKKPNNKIVTDYLTSAEKGCVNLKRPTQIWIAS